MISLKRTFILAAGALALSGLSANAASKTISQSGSYDSFSGDDVTISGTAEVHVTSKTGLSNASVNLQGENAWLYADNIKPSDMMATYLKNIKIDGVAADLLSNVRLAQYRGGSVVIPHGYESFSKALTVYDKPNCQGNSKEISVETYHTNLGTFDNNIRSFKLKKGFQVCLANNSDGTGHSRIYIADEGDLVVNELPDGFVTKDGSDKAFISFIRVVKHQWVSKKGWAGWNNDVINMTNSTHSYGWSAGSPKSSTDFTKEDLEYDLKNANEADHEFIPQRHHDAWPSFGEINRNSNVSHMLGDNEPDNTNDPKETPSSPDHIAGMWMEYLKSGLRVGSPAPTSIWGSWLGTFFNILDSLNYRCDFVVYHQYEATTDFASRINKAVEVSKGRPVWVTEWNNGANWTSESWPTSSGPQRDADLNIIYDGNGNTTTVNRPLSPENSDKQVEYIKTALANQDKLDKLERLHFYNAVQDARAVELGGKLTPAGKVFAEYNQKLAYTKKSEFVHEWKIACPRPWVEYSSDYKNVRLSWYDHNGETGKCYKVLRRDGTRGAYSEVATLELGKDYEAGKTVVFEERIDMEDVRSYIVRGVSYKDETSINSRVNTITRDHVTMAPSFTAMADDPFKVTLTFTVEEGTRGVRIERRDADDAEFKTLIEQSVGNNSYVDEKDLVSGKDYWYRMTALSNADGEPVSEIQKVHVPSINEAPEAVYNLFAASGDKQVVISWDKTYSTKWDIERADAPEGPFTVLASKSSSVKYTDKTVENGKTYYYRVTPDRLGLTGEPSKVISATPQEGQFFYVPFSEGKGAPKEHYSGNHGSINGTCFWSTDRNGVAGQAVSVSSAGQGHVSFPSRIFNTLNDFTLGIWFKVNKDGAKGRVFDFGTGSDQFMIMDYNGNVANTFRFKFKGGGVEKNVDMKNPVKTGEWNHICVSQTNKVATIYLNGEKIGTMSGSNNLSAIKPTQNYLGKSQWESDPYADYSFDDLYIYTRGMNADEVKELMGRTTDVEEITAEGFVDGLAVTGNGSEITIVSDAPRTVNIYTVNGALVRSAMVEEGVNILTGFDKGVYIVGSHKIAL